MVCIFTGEAYPDSCFSLGFDSEGCFNSSALRTQIILNIVGTVVLIKIVAFTYQVGFYIS